MIMLLSLLGIGLGLIKDITRTLSEEDGDEFDWMAWLGERPLQVVLRLTATVGVLAPEATELVQETLSSVDLSGVSTLTNVAVPVLVGLYADKVGKKLLGRAEDILGEIPILGKLSSWGKKLT